MRSLLAVYRRELLSYVTTPTAYVFVAVFLFAIGLFTFQVGGFFPARRADLGGFFAFHPWLFMVFLPAYARTITAIGYFRKRNQELSWREIAEAFGNSAVLGLMALPASAFVFLVINEIGAAIVTSESTTTGRHVLATIVSVGFAVWVTQRAWPVNER